MHPRNIFGILIFGGFGMSTKGPYVKGLSLSLWYYRKVVEHLGGRSNGSYIISRYILEGNFECFASFIFSLTFSWRKLSWRSLLCHILLPRVYCATTGLNMVGQQYIG